MAVYDSFMFFNEFDLLSVRLEEHDPFVDCFILVQADRNHAGKKKELLFSKEDSRFKKYAHKIILVNAILQENPKSAWDNESAQRQAALNAVPFKPEDIIYLSDVDEIISRDKWSYLLKRMEKELLLGVWLRMFYYSINLELIDHPWAMAKLVKGKVVLERELAGNTLRCSPAAVITPFPCGWHFSYLLSVDGIIEKISSLAHQENNTDEFKDPARIMHAIRQKRDLFGREMTFEAVRVDESWPLAMIKSEKWEKFIFPLSKAELLKGQMSSLVAFSKGPLKRLIQPLLRAFKRPFDTPNGHNNFGSELFDRLIVSAPKHFDTREWRRLIEFFGFVLPELEGRLSAENCGKLFLKIVTTLVPGSKIVLLGASGGRAAVIASRAASVVDSQLYCVDSWDDNEQMFRDFRRNLLRCGCDNVVIYRGKSRDIADSWPHGSIDFLFVDSGSEYKSVINELKSWIPHLKPNGIIFGEGWDRQSMVEIDGSLKNSLVVTPS